jgi:uncharacterized phage protein gp47/JayE
MPNALTSTGLQTMTRDELVTYFTDEMQSIYGADINLDSDTPDGQMMNIFIQAMLDMQDLLTQIYNSMNPDTAFGVTLDERCAINGIQRQAGTRTITNVTLTISQAVTLYGADQDVEPIYTVADDAGNNWQLITTTVISSLGDNILAFRAENLGKILSLPNTITNPVTIVLGVDAINNPTTYTTLGLDEETDAALKLRRQKAVAQSSQGYLAGLYAALGNITGISSVKIYENNTAATDSDGTPSHSIWIILGGSASSASIANAIYYKRNAGCGMRGDQTYTISQIDGTDFIVKWDVIEAVDLFIQFTVTSLDGTTIPDIAGIKTGLLSLFVPELFEKVNVNDLATQVQIIDSNSLVTNAGFSLTSGGSYTTTLIPLIKNQQFVLSEANIIVLPIMLTSENSLVAVVGGVVTTTLVIAAGGSTETFTTVGGYGSITWSKISGSGSIGSSSGIYTSGVVGSAIIRATDSLGNYSEATITVI